MSDCAQCGEDAPEGELCEMDFGPYRGQIICYDCWDATQPSES